MTEAEIQAAVQALYEGDTSTPDSTSEEYLARRAMINAGINRWEHNEGTLWNELWTDLDAAADGDKTTADGTLEYDAPTDFVFPGGYVRLVDSAGASNYFSVVKPDKFQLFDNENKTICTFIGNPKDGFTLKFLDDPDGVYTIAYEYYKTADTMTTTSSVAEMLDPYFLVYFTLSRLLKEERPDLSREQLEEAEARLRQMKIKNMMSANWQVNRVDDMFGDQGVGGFGQ